MEKNSKVTFNYKIWVCRESQANLNDNITKINKLTFSIRMTLIISLQDFIFPENAFFQNLRQYDIFCNMR